MKRLFEVKFNLLAESDYCGERYGRLWCVFSEISTELERLRREGYNVSDLNWVAPNFILTVEDDIDNADVVELKQRVKNLQREIRNKIQRRS